MPDFAAELEGQLWKEGEFGQEAWSYDVRWHSLVVYGGVDEAKGVLRYEVWIDSCHGGSHHSRRVSVLIVGAEDRACYIISPLNSQEYTVDAFGE